MTTFAILSGQSMQEMASLHQMPVLLVIWPFVVFVTSRWPIVGMLGTFAILRIGFTQACCTDQILVSQTAWERLVSGAGGPYGVGYASTIPPGASFPYGPLGLICWLPGSIVEVAAALAIMAVLAWQRALLTLAIFAVWIPSVWLQWIGVNDYSPGLLILVAMVVMRYRPRLGAGVLAFAAALKPYAFAWFLPTIGYAGLGAAVVLFAATAILWSPLFIWWGGHVAFLETVRIANASHRVSEYALNLPSLRWIAIAIAFAGLFVRRWEGAVLLGAATFVVFLFLDYWASYGYWLAVLPVAGLALESLLGLTRLSSLPEVRAVGHRWLLEPNARELAARPTE